MRDNNGNAEDNIKINELLAIKWLNDVFLRLGRIFVKTGIL